MVFFSVSLLINVTFGKTKVTAKTSVRYLGIDLDQSLDGKFIAEAILIGNSRLKFPWRQDKFLNQYSKKHLALFLILCHILIMPALLGRLYGGLQRPYQ